MADMTMTNFGFSRIFISSSFAFHTKHDSNNTTITTHSPCNGCHITSS